MIIPKRPKQKAKADDPGHNCVKCGAWMPDRAMFVHCASGKECPESDGKGSMLDRILGPSDPPDPKGKA